MGCADDKERMVMGGLVAHLNALEVRPMALLQSARLKGAAAERYLYIIVKQFMAAVSGLVLTVSYR
jgi:hypothetical protein